MLLEGAVQGDGVILGSSLGLMRAVSGSICLISSRIRGITNTCLQAHVIISCIFQKISQPVYHLSRFINPYTDQIAVHITGTITNQFLHSLDLIDGKLRILLNRFLLKSGIDSSDILTDTSCRLSLLYDQNFGALFCGGHGSDPSTGTTSDYQHLGINTLSNIRFSDLRCSSQPVS